jgi:hypothetical protein
VLSCGISDISKERKAMSARIKDALFRLLNFDPSPGRDLRPPIDVPVPIPIAAGIDPEDARSPDVSPLYRRLLAEFVLPNSASAVAGSPYWNQAFPEPVKTVLGRLKAQGLLVELDDPRVRLCHSRNESDLRVLCLEHGLQPMGSADQLIDRLLTLDPSGWLLGYAGELLQCSETAAPTMVTQKQAPAGASMQPSAPPGRIEPASDNEIVWEMLKGQVQLTAREGNLALCRNVHLAMANHLLRRNKPTRALQALCIVCLFDLCGARNRDDAPAEIRKSYSRFDATGASLAPWLVRRVSDLSRDMTLSMDQIRDIFLGVSTRLKIPKDPRKLWAVLQLALEGGLDSDDEMRRGRHIRHLLE